MKVLALVLVLAVCGLAEDSDTPTGEGRQKRLLFFDEGGNLVQTYSNPYMNKLSENSQTLPFYGSFLNPFFNFIRHFGTSLAAYTIPVSNAIIQSIQKDPYLQNTLVIIPKKDTVVEPNPLCDGKRTQIPTANRCSNFLNCWDGWAFEQECPTGLLFSTNGYCDYADNVDCHNRKLDVTLPQTQPLCSKDFEAFRNQMNCNEFFICVNRSPVKFKCPADLAYNQYLGVCDYANRVDCTSAGLIPLPSQPTIPAAPPAPPAPPSLTPVIPSIPVSVIPETPAQPPAVPSPPVPSIPAVEPSLPPAVPSLPPLAPSLPPAAPSLPPVAPSLPSLPPALIPTVPDLPIAPASPPAVPELPAISPALPPSIPQLPSTPISRPPSPLIPISPPKKPLIPSIISAILPSQRPLPTLEIDVFPAPVHVQPKPSHDQPINTIFTPGCSNANVAMSREDAIRLLQQQPSVSY